MMADWFWALKRRAVANVSRQTLKNGLLCLLLCLALALIGQGTWIQAKAVLAQWLIHSAWIDSDPRAKPWPWADTWPVSRLTVERLGADLITLQGIEGNSLAFGPGVIEIDNSHGGTSVLIAGHKDTHFRFLEGLKVDDRIRLQNPNSEPVDYQVRTIRVVDSREQKLLLDAGEDLVLVTCYPFDTVTVQGPLRLVVYAQRVTKRVMESRYPQPALVL